MRLFKNSLIAALLLAPVVAGAQGSGSASDPKTATVHATMRFVIPAMFRVAETAPATATFQGERYAEYLIKYTVAANTQWVFAADALPHGVTLLAWGGEWRGGNDSDLVVQRGAVTNGTEILVRVRVADGASPNWRTELRFSAAQSVAATRIVAED